MVNSDAHTLAGGSRFRLPDVPPTGSSPGEATWLPSVDRSFQELDENHQRILTLRTSFNLSYEEIAQELKVGVGTVKTQIAKAREALHALLMQNCPGF